MVSCCYEFFEKVRESEIWWYWCFWLKSYEKCLYSREVSLILHAPCQIWLSPSEYYLWSYNLMRLLLLFSFTMIFEWMNYSLMPSLSSKISLKSSWRKSMLIKLIRLIQINWRRRIISIFVTVTILKAQINNFCVTFVKHPSIDVRRWQIFSEVMVQLY